MKENRIFIINPERRFFVPELFWLLLGDIFLAIEVMTLGLTSIWFVFAGGALLAEAAAFVGVPLYVQLIIFIVVALIIFIVVTCLLFVLTRPLAAKKYLNSKVEKTNAEALIGQKGVVKERIQNKMGKGTVFINGMNWPAKSLNGKEIKEDTEVLIHEIQGVKLIVKAAEDKEE